MMFIVPKFKTIFDEMLNGKPLPDLTLWVMSVSQFMVNHFLLIFGAIAAGVIGFKIFAATPFGSQLLDTVKLKLPVVGDLLTKTAISRFTRTLAGTLGKFRGSDFYRPSTLPRTPQETLSWRLPSVRSMTV